MGETINNRIAQCRKLANMTQTDAAEKMGMKCSTYSQMERKGAINTKRLLELAKIFDVHPDYLLYGREMKSQQAENVDFNSAELNPNDILLRSNSFTPTPAQETSLLLSKKEENIIKIIRYLPKNEKDEVMSYIEEKYKNKR